MFQTSDPNLYFKKSNEKSKKAEIYFFYVENRTKNVNEIIQIVKRY